jgi:nucleoside-diphosphate-sugar epimerase
MTDAPRTIEELHERASRPSAGVVASLADVEDDILVLGAGGKMGFHLCRMLQRALETAGKSSAVIGVSRFGNDAARAIFEEHGIETIAANVCSLDGLRSLPDATNVFFLAGVKFGTAQNPALLEKMNVTMPALVGERFHRSTIVALSTGCVYSFATPESGGSTEDSPTRPIGDYAVSCLGREQSFDETSATYGTRISLVRLNYAVDLRYGVIVDIARNVLQGAPIDVSMGHVNFIWQGDALAHIIRSRTQASRPPWVLNVTGIRILRVRELAEAFGRRFGKPVDIRGEERPTAWLNNSARAVEFFGAPEVDEDKLCDWVADWLERGGETLDKPTHFENRDGNY